MRSTTASGAGLVSAPFPNPVEGPLLVLFLREDGGIELRWRIYPAPLEHARAAFAADADPHARLLLRGLDGDARDLAGADLADADLLSAGTARYDAPDTEGPLQAEIGLGDDAGGWLLVARSNRLEATGPVGVDFLRGDAARGGGADADVASNQSPVGLTSCASSNSDYSS